MIRMLQNCFARQLECHALRKVVTNLLCRGNRNVMIYTSCYKLAFPRQSNHQDCFIEIELVVKYFKFSTLANQ